jgi:hypothetical protein
MEMHACLPLLNSPTIDMKLGELTLNYQLRANTRLYNKPSKKKGTKQVLLYYSYLIESKCFQPITNKNRQISLHKQTSQYKSLI